YFATGDIDNAIRTQKRALKLMPHSAPLLRQLAEFEAAKQKSESRKGNRETEVETPAPATP
ncbi:MAG: hypothetical protein ACR2NZ_11340, partial [Rubripirellula sp.]